MSRSTIPDLLQRLQQAPHLEEGDTDLLPGLAAAVGGGRVGEQLVGLGVGQLLLRLLQLCQQRRQLSAAARSPPRA